MNFIFKKNKIIKFLKTKSEQITLRKLKCMFKKQKKQQNI